MKIIMYLFILVFLPTNLYASPLHITHFQTKFKALGYYSGSITGFSNDDFRNAIDQVREHMNYSCQKEINRETCSLLLEFERKYLLK